MNIGQINILLANDVVYEEQYLIYIYWDLEIDGNGHDLTAGFEISNGANVEMRNVRLRNVRDDGTFADGSEPIRRLSTAYPDWGALYVTGGASLTLVDMEVSNCIASDGAGVYVDDGTVNLQNVTFENNAALGGSSDPPPYCEGGCGGAIYVGAGGNLTCVNSSFHSNYAVGNGGAVASDGPSEFNGCDFVSNYAHIGGAVSATNQTRLDDCDFECNWCGRPWGAGCTLMAGALASNTSSFTLSPWEKSEVFPQRLFDENAVDGGETCDDGMQEVLDELRAYLNETGDWSELQDWLENRTIDHLEDWLNARHNTTRDELEDWLNARHNTTRDELEDLMDERHNQTRDELEDLMDDRHNTTRDELVEWIDMRHNTTRDELVEWIDVRHNTTRDELVEWIDGRHNQTRDEIVAWIDSRHNTTRDELVEWIDSRHNLTRDELIAFFGEELQKTNDLIVEEFKEQNKTILQPLYSLLWAVVCVGLIGGAGTALYVIFLKPAANVQDKGVEKIGALSLSRIHKYN